MYVNGCFLPEHTTGATCVCVRVYVCADYVPEQEEGMTAATCVCVRVYVCADYVPEQEEGMTAA